MQGIACCEPSPTALGAEDSTFRSQHARHYHPRRRRCRRQRPEHPFRAGRFCERHTKSPPTPAQLKDQLHPRALDLIKLLRPAALLPVCAFGASSVSCPSR